MKVTPRDENKRRTTQDNRRRTTTKSKLHHQDTKCQEQATTQILLYRSYEQLRLPRGQDHNDVTTEDMQRQTPEQDHQGTTPRGPHQPNDQDNRRKRQK